MFNITRLATATLIAFTVSGCAMVSVGSVSSEDYLSARRGDVLTTGKLSASSRTALQVVGTDEEGCNRDLANCRKTLIANIGLSDEQRLSTLSELWLQEALRHEEAQILEPANDALKAATLSAFLESAKHAYAYLFFTSRTPDLRAMEDRQAQVRDYYNFSTQQAVVGLFNRYRDQLERSVSQDKTYLLDFDPWQVSGSTAGISLSHKGQLPKELVAASSLTFKGLRNQYRRDGLGAELVAVFADSVVKQEDENKPWSETPFPSITVMLRFPGNSIDTVLAGNRVELQGFDPHRNVSVDVRGIRVPLAANFTSGYGLWLARSGFAQESLLSLIGRSETLDKPRIYLMQPFDPNRRVILMLHGLASSPEAWVNVANELLGDEELRQNYQIWQVYYPTNLPLPFNNREIREAVNATLKNFDPQGKRRASNDMVLIGHSMGGVLARLMVSNSGDTLWEAVLERYNISQKRETKLRQKIEPYVIFDAMPQPTRAIFIAAPHRGTPYAENRFARFVSGLIRLPATVLSRVTEIGQLLVNPDEASNEPLVGSINSIKNLSDQDPFVRESSKLPISSKVTYHSIMGNVTPEVILEASSDGVVPYASAKLEGSASELVVNSWHSVQETPEAIVEIRRILHEHLNQLRTDQR
ncbi:alpha/beta fold hydrolase [uncultured Limnobacter sp.]|uniref:esterase/lipase family protein n=1 Tax=uncultured Limnobacter sp. TaxID=199681 RepID=UPI0030FC170A